MKTVLEFLIYKIKIIKKLFMHDFKVNNFLKIYILNNLILLNLLVREDLEKLF